MENQLSQIFQYQNKQMRTILIDGEPWFVAKDVCDILEIGNPTMALARLDDDEKQTLRGKENLLSLTEDPNITQLALVNEAGLYSLILGSRKTEAKQFKRWVTHEVLPQIRQTGKYISPNTEQNDKRWKFDFTANLLKDFGDSLSPEAKNALLSNIFEELFGRPMLPKPAVRRTITASKLAERLGISAQKFGRLITKAGNIRNNPKYGLTILDKSKYSDKNIVNFAYFEDKAEEIINILQPLIDKERKKSK